MKLTVAEGLSTSSSLHRVAYQRPSASISGKLMLSCREPEGVSREAKRQRIAAGRRLRVDETKPLRPSDTMLVRRLVVAAADNGEIFLALLGDYEVNKLFNAGMLCFEKP